MDELCGGNTPSRYKTLREVFFSNPSAIRMAPSSPIPPLPAVQHTNNENRNIQPSVKETITLHG
jgi:hypothetical protein